MITAQLEGAEEIISELACLTDEESAELYVLTPLQHSWNPKYQNISADTDIVSNIFKKC
jgi:hypothetical protein